MTPKLASRVVLVCVAGALVALVFVYGLGALLSGEVSGKQYRAVESVRIACGPATARRFEAYMKVLAPDSGAPWLDYADEWSVRCQGKESVS